MSIPYSQDAMNRLHDAQNALERAVKAYAECQGNTELSTLDGKLFETLDNVDTAQSELRIFLGLAKRGYDEHDK